jgi:hypothetical protein
MADVDAVRERLADRIVAATGISTNFDRMLIGGKSATCASTAPIRITRRCAT